MRKIINALGFCELFLVCASISHAQQLDNPYKQVNLIEKHLGSSEYMYQFACYRKTAIYGANYPSIMENRQVKIKIQPIQRKFGENINLQGLPLSLFQAFSL